MHEIHIIRPVQRAAVCALKYTSYIMMSRLQDTSYIMMSRLQDSATKLQQLKQKKRLCRSLEVILLSSVIPIIGTIFAAPTITFVLSSETDSISTINEVTFHVYCRVS